MINIKLFNYLLFTSLLLLSINHANAGRGKLLLEGLEFFGRKTMSRTFPPSHIALRRFASSPGVFVNKIVKETPQLKNE